LNTCIFKKAYLFTTFKYKNNMSNIGKAIRKANNTPFIKYYPELGKAFNSICAAVLLKQIDYLFEANGNEPFYKFKAPCEHELYQVGRSWIEELGVCRSEFDKALARLGAVKVVKGVKLVDAKERALIVYCTDKNRVTWYWLNVTMYEDLLECAFHIKSPNELFIEKAQTGFTFPIKELKKDKSEEQNEKNTRPTVKKPAKEKQVNLKPTSYFQNELLNNPEQMAKVRTWCSEAAKEKIGQSLSVFRHTYTEQQLNAYCEHYATILDVPVYKTMFTQTGDIISCDLVHHIINKAKFELENKGKINIPLPQMTAAAIKQRAVDVDPFTKHFQKTSK
jgi:hypothetical protein